MRQNIVKFIIIIASVVCIIWLFGLGWVLLDYNKGAQILSAPLAVEIEENQIADGFHLLALGDSLARGTGDDEGKGFVGRVVDDLESESEEKILLRNLGIKGYTSGQLVNQVSQKEIQRGIQQADIILLSIGGNDLFRGGQTLIDLNEENVKHLQESYSTNLRKILIEIRELNTDGTVFMIGLYNPFIESKEGERITRIVQGWNFETMAIASEFSRIVIVPTFDLFQLNVDSYLYSDKFHPNSNGYQLIADRLSSLIPFDSEEVKNE